MRVPVVQRVLIAAVLGWPIPAAAQAIPRHDVSVMFGWSSANRPRPDLPYNNWLSAWFGTATGGWYWTDHQKTEITAGASTERMHGGTYDYLQTSPLSHTTRVTTIGLRSQVLSGAQLYQFFHNAMVHPFVGAGVEVDRERWRTETVEEKWIRIIAGNLVHDEMTSSTTTSSPPETRYRVAAFGVAGLKAYFSERTFFRAEIVLAARAKADRFSWRIGGGFDF